MPTTTKARPKTYREQLLDITRDYVKRSHCKEYVLDDLVKWAIDEGLWTLSPRDRFLIARKDFHNALRQAKDDEGIRVFLDAKIEQTRMWADRHDATWNLRQQFLNEQLHRLRRYREAIIAMCETLNRERRKGERQFTLKFEDEE